MNNSYKRVALTQESREWHEWRHQGIGASDAPTIMGENPWAWSEQLLLRKKGSIREEPPNEAMAAGAALEPEARAHYCKTAGIRVEPACLQSLTCEWLRCSVDGITADGRRVVEIKCGQSAYSKTAISRHPPKYYVGQLQHILAVTGLPVIDFLCYYPSKVPLLIEVRRDDAYIGRLLDAEQRFWERVRS